MYNEFIIQQIKTLQRTNRVKPGVRSKPSPEWKYPIRWQREYQTRLVLFVRETQKIFTDLVLSQTERIFKERDILFNQDSADSGYLITLRYRIDSFNNNVNNDTYNELVKLIRTFRFDSEKRTDDGLDDLESLNNRYDIRLNEIKDKAIQNVLNGTPEGIDDFNRAQWKKIIRAKLGIDLFTFEPWLQPLIRAWNRSNVSLITKMLDDQRRLFEEIILRNYSSGQRHTTMIADIENSFNVTRNRAKLISRDQTNKLNGDMMRQRQTDIGITEYTWKDSDDQRVRNTHKEFDGKIFSWAEGSPEGNPGQPIQCRCWGDPVWDEIDAELKK